MDTQKRILIVDDDADHLLLCNYLFRRRGYDVLPLLGCDPIEELHTAIDIFQPMLIFMDHYMPGICGLDAIRELKANPLYRSIPIVYFSIHKELTTIAEQAGADEYFQKPFQADDLIKIADRYVA